MIGRLQGKLVSSSGNQLLIDVNGVGYEVSATSSVLSQSWKPGEVSSVLIYTDVKENAILLYGFCDLLEKQVFLLLKKVKGIGSRLALGIVSSIGAVELLANIGRSDVAALQRVPGIGKKTAQRLIVELRETVGQLASGNAESESEFVRAALPVGTPGMIAGGPAADACLALEKLGFAPETAKRAVKEAEKECVLSGSSAALDAGELLRRALTKL